MRTFLVCAASAAMALGLAVAAPTASAGTKVTSPNLIRNGNAEAGTGSTDGSTVTVPSWTITTGTGFTAVQYGASGGFPGPTDPGPPGRGANFLAGGPSDGVATATQTRPLSAYRTSIDAGTATFALSGFLGGFGSQDDNAVLRVDWLNGGGHTLGTSSIGPVTAADRTSLTGLLKRNAHGPVPMKARKVLVTLTLTRTSGSYNDGYADNLSLKISTPS